MVDQSVPMAIEEIETKNDRLLATLAHGLVIANLGAIGAAVIYALNKGKSRYVAFQAAQAAVYQLVGIIVIIAVWGCWTALYIASLTPIMVNPKAYPEPPAFFWLGLLSMVIPFAVMGVYWLYGLWGALRAFQGRPFHYLLIGPWLERYCSGK
ncbi:MAG: DUF4870 domain-containing protein [Anaerolineae bacterium]